MGLLKEIVLLPVAPLRGVLWTVDQALDAAEREYAGNLRRELVEWEQALNSGQVTEAQFDRREDEILDELDRLHRGETGAGAAPEP